MMSRRLNPICVGGVGVGVGASGFVRPHTRRVAAETPKMFSASTVKQYWVFGSSSDITAVVEFAGFMIRLNSPILPKLTKNRRSLLLLSSHASESDVGVALVMRGLLGASGGGVGA